MDDGSNSWRTAMEAVRAAILTITVALSGGLTLLNMLYQQRPGAANKPVKGYVQIGSNDRCGSATGSRWSN